MEETVFYDDTECDGYCLMEELEQLLESRGINPLYKENIED